MSRLFGFLLCLLFVSSSAHAESRPDNRVQVQVATDATFRGISQSDSHPAFELRADTLDQTGVYLGGSLGSQDVPVSERHVRADLYTGYTIQAPSGLRFDLGVRGYSDAFVYQGQPWSGLWELYGGVKLGPAGLEVARDQENRNTYLAAVYNTDLGSGIYTRLHGGYYLLHDARDYTDYAASLGKRFAGLNVALTAVTNTQRPRSSYNETRVLLSLSYLF